VIKTGKRWDPTDDPVRSVDAVTTTVSGTLVSLRCDCCIWYVKLSVVIGISCNPGSIDGTLAPWYSCIQAMGYLSVATTLKHDILGPILATCSAEDCLLHGGSWSSLLLCIKTTLQ
jgi:hypothetical protein